ncbi:MAG: thioredoxin-dependent thiol peroxidase [Armatimonadetes bacterium]|nr:thioredoxin-dependent thiol peroxidase [Armatimonadota bacterium]
MAQVSEGSKAPDFRLPASTGGEIGLADYRGKQIVVLYFYPRDMTPGCTQEACSFRDLQEEFAELGAVILGVSTDDLASHSKFQAKHDLNFPLLSDVDAKVAQAYGVWQEKSMYGKKSMGIVRTTFVIDRDGVVRKIYPKVKVDQHADAVLDFVKSLT